MVCSQIAYPTRRVINFIIETHNNVLCSLDLIYFYAGKVNMLICSYKKYKYKIECEYNIIPSSPQLKLTKGPIILLKFLLYNCNTHVGTYVRIFSPEYIQLKQFVADVRCNNIRSFIHMCISH